MALSSELLQDQTRQDVRASSQPDLGLEYIRWFSVPVPPRAEQDGIVRRVEKLFALADAVERRVAAARKQADALPQAISGKLVPTEAELARQEGRDYEPASVLLERIRQERAAQPKAGRSRRRGG